MNAVSRRTIGCLLTLVAVAGCAPDSADEGSVSAYLERLGNDTLAVEVVRRSPGLIRGEVLARTPVTRYMTYEMEFDDSGALVRFSTEHVTPAQNPGGPGRWFASVALEGGRATIAREVQDGADTVSLGVSALTVATIGRIPVPTGILEHAIRAADLDAAGSEAVVEVLSPWGTNPRTTPTAISSRGGSEYELDFFGSPMVITVDGAGQVTGISGAQTTMKVEVEPIAEPDVAALAADFATRDFEGVGIGAPSPPATVEASVGGVSLTVEYSQPSRRGREIWGALVPYGEVWRTGANAATHLSTDGDLELGNLVLPAGTYTLWTTFTADEATLIVNSQTQIWGTAHSPAADIGRTALDLETLAEPVEAFTIAVEEDGGDNTLTFSWDDRKYAVRVQAR